MTAITKRFDPWGPISTVLYEIGNSEFVLNAINNTGVTVEWRPLTKEERFSNSTRIRAYREDIARAYLKLNDDDKGQFAQIVVKAILERPDGPELCSKMIDRLHDIGWTISDGGALETEDALISEQFFQPNSEYDAYVTIRDILAKGSTKIIVVDAYVGSSLLLTLRALPSRSLTVMVLTVEKNLKSDFLTEVAAFRKQVAHISLEVRAMGGFHDRFIVIDGNEFYHVGASIKDAGKRAFMISRLEDQPNIDSLKAAIRQAWTGGKPLL